jgi:hypothetical protein
VRGTAPLGPPDPATLHAGAEVDLGDGGPATVEAHRVASLTVGDTGVIVCDPFRFRDAPRPLTAPIGPGRYAVTVYSVGHGAPPRRTVAAAVLHLAPDAAVRWAPGLVAGQDPATLGAGEYFGFGVDAGVACFADAGAVTAMLASAGVVDLDAWRGLPGSMADRPALARQLLDAAEVTFDAYDESILAGLDGPGGSVPGFGLPGDGSEDNVVVFAAGFGDGAYPVWLGYDGAGRLVDVTADFLVLPR